MFKGDDEVGVKYYNADVIILLAMQSYWPLLFVGNSLMKVGSMCKICFWKGEQLMFNGDDEVGVKYYNADAIILLVMQSYWPLLFLGNSFDESGVNV